MTEATSSRRQTCTDLEIVESNESSLFIVGQKRPRLKQIDTPDQKDNSIAEFQSPNKRHNHSNLEQTELSTSIQVNLRENSTRTDSRMLMDTSLNNVQMSTAISSLLPFGGSVQTPLSANSLVSVLNKSQSLETQIYILRGKYPEIVIESNKIEDQWKCDICLSMEGEDDDELSICDLCMVVVHPSCYRRDLYDQDPNDDSSWFCARCKHLLNNQTANQMKAHQLALPGCHLCPDPKGAILDMIDGSWVHITCINWINEIWFNTNDTKLNMYSGNLNFSRYQLTCYLCSKKQGQCIECDISTCPKPFHVRCAMNEGLIQSVESMDSQKVDEWNVKIFCNKHQKKGSKQIKDMKAARQSKHNNPINLVEEGLDRIQTRFRDGKTSRQSIVERINLDDVMLSPNEEQTTPLQANKNQFGELELFHSNQQIKASLEDVNDMSKKPVAKGKKSAAAKRPATASMTQETQLDLPKVQPVSKKAYVPPPEIINSKMPNQYCHQNPHITTISVKAAQTRQCQSRNSLQIDDINTECKVKFKIDKALSNYLHLNEWCTFKDLTIGFLKFHQSVQDFYDKPALSFNAYKYPFFQRFFPDQAKITSMDLKKYLLKKHK